MSWGSVWRGLWRGGWSGSPPTTLTEYDMNLRQQIGLDEASVFLNQNDYGESALIHPNGGSPSFVAQVLFNESDLQLLPTPDGVVESVDQRATLLTSEISAGMFATTGFVRSLRHGDTIEITDATSSNFGTWIIETAVNTIGGNIEVRIRQDEFRAASGQNRSLPGG